MSAVSLCPVSAVQTYLRRTSSWTTGRLFRREQGGTLTTNGIRQQILYFIKEADPQSIPKAHQVRALATSINFFQHMDFKAITHYTGWKSSNVFIKHYLKNIEATQLPAVAAGKIVLPMVRTSGSDNSELFLAYRASL